MVTVIKTGHSIHRIFTYNEQKVKEGVAHCIAAVNYPKDLELLTPENKLNRLLHQAALNDNVRRNSVHISLNFDPSESLSRDQLYSIAQTYMHKIGFGAQPYLVYQHLDAGHPHIHVVTIKIRRDGSRIETQNIGRNQSQKARKEIEESFGLLPAERKKVNAPGKAKQPYVEKVQYGKGETRSAISGVVQWVVEHYKYTSLEALNAVLRQYNVVADRGSEGSRTRQHQGLVYRIIDEKGQRKGVPIKASELEGKPILKLLEQRFRDNLLFKNGQEKKIKTALDWTLAARRLSFGDFVKALQKESISVYIPQVHKPMSEDIIYIDHRTACVFEAKELGAKYRIGHLEEQLGWRQQLRLSERTNEAQKQGTRQVLGPGTKAPSLASNGTTEDMVQGKQQENKPRIRFSHF